MRYFGEMGANNASRRDDKHPRNIFSARGRCFSTRLSHLFLFRRRLYSGLGRDGLRGGLLLLHL